jgi:hypothetical protein
MLTFRKAREAFSEIRTMHIGNAKNDPKTWDIALGLEAMVVELDSRLSTIERDQQEILRLLRQQR